MVGAVALPPETLKKFCVQTDPPAEQKQLILVLCISKLPKRISGHPAIAGKDVQVTVIPKEQLAPIVIGGWFFNLQDYPKEEISRPSIKTPSKR